MAIPIVGKVFTTPEAFLDYLEGLQFNAWRPRFLTVHHTASPDLKLWNSWQTRRPPVTDEQWLKNLAAYYARPASQGGRGWNAWPHFFTTPKGIGVGMPPTARGIHAASFNSLSWGLEICGNFDTEKFEGPIADMSVGAMAAMHLAMSWQPGPYSYKIRGLHFHRDDPLTSKTCPGRNIQKLGLTKMVADRMAAMSSGDEHPEEVPTAPEPIQRKGTVNTPGDTLSVRAGPSQRNPVVRTLAHGTKVVIDGEAMNGPTKWYDIGDNEWIAAAYVKVA